MIDLLAHILNWFIYRYHKQIGIVLVLLWFVLAYNVFGDKI